MMRSYFQLASLVLAFASESALAGGSQAGPRSGCRRFVAEFAVSPVLAVRPRPNRTKPDGRVTTWEVVDERAQPSAPSYRLEDPWTYTGKVDAGPIAIAAQRPSCSIGWSLIRGGSLGEVIRAVNRQAPNVLQWQRLWEGRITQSVSGVITVGDNGVLPAHTPIEIVTMGHRGVLNAEGLVHNRDQQVIANVLRARSSANIPPYEAFINPDNVLVSPVYQDAATGKHIIDVFGKFAVPGNFHLEDQDGRVHSQASQYGSFYVHLPAYPEANLRMRVWRSDGIGLIPNAKEAGFSIPVMSATNVEDRDGTPAEELLSNGRIPFVQLSSAIHSE